MRPLISFNDDQLNQLRATAASLPLDQRTHLVRLVAGFMQVEGDLASSATFARALRFAVDSVHSRNEGTACG
jgi:hypothetical protein